MAEFRTHYDNLQVVQNASEAVIRAAYRTLTQKHHPDKNPEDVETAHARIKIINRAYEVLSNPKQRADYDAWVNQQEAELARSDSIARERELLLKQQELARRVRQEERRRQQAEEELENLRTEYLKEKALAQRRALPMPPQAASPAQALLASPMPAPQAAAALAGAWMNRGGTAIFALVLVALAGYGFANRFMEEGQSASRSSTPIVEPPAKEGSTNAVADAKAASTPGGAAGNTLSIARHLSRKGADQAILADGGKPWDEVAIAALEKNQMWGPNLQGGSENFFVKIRNESSVALNGAVFELSDKPCDNPRGAQIAYYVLKLQKPLAGKQSSSYSGNLDLNADYAKNPSGMCGSIVSAW